MMQPPASWASQWATEPVVAAFGSQFPKLDVAGSNPVSRSNNPFKMCALGAIKR